MNNQMMPLATNDEMIKGDRQDTMQQLALDDDVEECLDFSYDGFQVVRREFFAHIFEPSMPSNDIADFVYADYAPAHDVYIDCFVVSSSNCGGDRSIGNIGSRDSSS